MAQRPRYRALAGIALLAATLIGAPAASAAPPAAACERPNNTFEKLLACVDLAGVREHPSRVKCATLSWHTLKAAVSGREDRVSTE